MCVAMQVCLKRFWLVLHWLVLLWEASRLRGAWLAVLGRDNVMDGTVLNYKVFSNRDGHTNTCLPEKASTEMCLECCKAAKEDDDHGGFPEEENIWRGCHRVIFYSPGGQWCPQEPRIPRRKVRIMVGTWGKVFINSMAFLEERYKIASNTQIGSFSQLNLLNSRTRSSLS